MTSNNNDPNRTIGSTSTSASIVPAQFPKDLQPISTLFTAYTNALGIDLSYQNFAHELASLPGKYAPEKGGALFLARAPLSCINSSTSQTVTQTQTQDSQPAPGQDQENDQEEQQFIGCAALRAFNPPHICELKRLYITPESRGLGAGKLLLERVVETAKELGYREMLLDTLASMETARRMYAAFGFEECEKYYESPIEGTVFMRLRLR